MKRFFPMIHVFIVVLSVAVLASGAFAAEQRFSVPVGNSPALGPSNAPVTLIEFIDYQ